MMQLVDRQHFIAVVNHLLYRIYEANRLISFVSVLTSKNQKAFRSFARGFYMKTNISQIMIFS